MKPYRCDLCYVDMEVYDNYEPIMCCSGYMCGCQALPTNPVFCDKCEEKRYGKVLMEEE